ncbi:hypothetical protein, partial [Gemmatimonas sp.]|uniref:hypothetical protein n=1 Tax=Gemmatimonas sp. TaxID=1962908 RepID=UPI0037C0B2BB
MSRSSTVESLLAVGLLALERECFVEAAEAFADVQQAMPHEIAVALMVANARRLAGNRVAERAALMLTYGACSIGQAEGHA